MSIAHLAEKKKDVNHLLILCSFTTVVWKFFLQYFDLFWVIPGMMGVLIAGFVWWLKSNHINFNNKIKRLKGQVMCSRAKHEAFTCALRINEFSFVIIYDLHILLPCVCLADMRSAPGPGILKLKLGSIESPMDRLCD